ncbi:hypothetical protein JZ751_008549 [Albula glossodonta]|uniref:Translin-associated factor X-interacting protein 1 N-terminal domain-containing protein n=1 Tax=Albula glossodonta TaxID=121402 RepID=A0A8T2N458_9TELE|nr:hypothetical protein JZ751_008549 [Albula glossodonta]
MADVVIGKSVSSESSFTGAEALPPIVSAADRKFFESLQKYIQDEKKRLTPSEGPNEQRYNIYRCAFDKVIERTSAYRMVLSAIKREYDEFIGAVRRSQCAARLSEGKRRASAARPTAVLYYRRSTAQLQHRTEIIRKSTTELHAELRELQHSREERSTDLTALEVYLEHLQQRRAELQRKIQNQYESQQVKAHLDSKVKRALNHRDKLSTKNQRLELRYKQMALVHEALSSWERSEKTVPLAQLLPSVLHQALVMAVPAGKQLPGRALAVEGVRAALECACMELVTHWVSQHRLTFSEELGDVISAHAHREEGVADTCLALAQVVYSTCGLHSKTALSIRELAFQLLQRLQQSGTLQRAVLGDRCCSVQDWREVAVLCRAGNRPHLAHAINCALTCLQGAAPLSPSVQITKPVEDAL